MNSIAGLIWLYVCWVMCSCIMQRGWSALMWACQTYAGTKQWFLSETAMANRREVVKILLKAGADVNVEAIVSNSDLGKSKTTYLCNVRIINK